MMNVIKGRGTKGDDQAKTHVRHFRNLQRGESMSKMAFTDRAAVSKNYRGDSVEESVKELRERLRERREAEATEEALKNRLRRWRIEDSRLIADARSRNTVKQSWFVRW